MTKIVDQETGEIYDTTKDGHGLSHEYKEPVVFIRTGFNYSMDRVSEDTALHCDDPSLAQQHQAEDADINTIVRRFGLTGEVPVLDRVPLEGDFHDITDFHSAMLAIRNAQEQFDTLPAEMRARFQNDPGEWYKFATDEKNRDEMKKMGLLKPATETQVLELGEKSLAAIAGQAKTGGNEPPVT